MSIENEDIYKLLCNVHKDIGELQSATTTVGAALRDHIAEDKQTIRAMYDTQVKPLADNVDILRLAQATQKGRTRVWGLVATAAGTLAGTLVGVAASLVKSH